MENVKLKVNKQSIVSDRQYLVSDTENVYQVEFEFDDEWLGYTKFGVFKQNDIVKQVLLVDDKCQFPNEVITEKGYVEMGVYGVNGDKRYPTIFTAPTLVKLGVMEGTDPVPPTPTEWQQIIAELSNIENELVRLDEDKVDKVEGMGLSQNSFTDANKQKLDSLENYDDTEIRSLIGNLQTSINNINNLLGNVPDGYGFLIVKKG